MRIAVGGLATRLARIVELGPRPRRPYPELVQLPSDRFERYLERLDPIDVAEARVELDLPQEAPDDLVEAIAGLAGGIHGRWRLAVEDAATQEQVTSLELIDAERSGYWQLFSGSEPGRVMLATSSAELVWSGLIAAARS